MDERMKQTYLHNLLKMSEGEFYEEATRIPRLIEISKKRNQWEDMKDYYLAKMNCLCEASKERLHARGIRIKELVI